MWRCFSVLAGENFSQEVCSTHVEMFLPLFTASCMLRCLLHACGDVSPPSPSEGYGSKFAPRMWRCFLAEIFDWADWAVCSTHVEMFHLFAVHCSIVCGLLHACGDVSSVSVSCSGFPEFAPRMWRCFPVFGTQSLPQKVCSTHVEMFPGRADCILHAIGLLHACGDVS